MSSLSKQIWASSTKFDIDDVGNKQTDFDVLIKENEIQKSLECDDLLFMEGHLKRKNQEFIDHEEMINDKKKDYEDDILSAGDFEGEFEEKMQIIEKRQAPTIGYFEKSQYFGKLFPSSKI